MRGLFASLRPAMLVAFAAAATPLIAAASADAARSRIAGLRELGAAFKSVNDSLRGGEVQPIIIQMSARQIRAASSAMPGWFPPGSGPESGVKTRAKPEIWSQAPRFKAVQDAFIAQAARFQAAANSNNPALIRAETVKLGATCKSCHDSFRQPD